MGPENKLDVFISYRWNETKEDVWRAADYLRQLGRFVIWLDKQEMYANKLERMEEGVKKADVVVIFFSDDYQSSIDCRTEAEAAYRHSKKKLFVKMQRTPCGVYQNWFAPIIGNNIYVDFYAFNDAAQEIAKHIDKLIADDQDEPTVCANLKVERFGDVPAVCNYTERPVEERALQEAVTTLCNAPEAGAVLVVGEGGIGKTTVIAKSIAACEPLLRRLSVGVLIWLNVYQLSMEKQKQNNEENGNNFDARAFYANFADRLNIKHGADDVLSRIQDHFKYLQKRAMCGRNLILLVLDDLFHEKIFQAAFRLGSNVRCIAISRHRNVAGTNCDQFISRVVEVNRLSNGDIVNMFQSICANAVVQQDRIQLLAELCSGLPLLASVLRAKLRRCTSRKQAELVIGKLTSNSAHLLVSERWNDDDKKQATISQLLLSGFENEPEHIRLKYFGFLVFDEGSAVELVDLAILWQCELDEALEVANEFCNMSLVRANYCDESSENDETYTVHAYLYAAALDFAINKEHIASDLSQLRSKLLAELSSADEENCLHLVARNRRGELLAMLMKAMKADQALMFQLCGNQQISTGETPLHCLLREQWPKNSGSAWETNYSLDVACELIDRMLLADHQNAMPILTELQDSGGKTILDLLIEMVEPGMKWYQNPLLVSASGDYRQVTGLLLENQFKMAVDPNVRDDEGNSALLIATKCWRPISLIYLLRHPRIDVNAANKNGETALIIAARQGDRDCVNILLNAPEIDLDAVDSNGNSAVICSVNFSRNKILRLLIDRGADVKLRNKLDESALCQALFHGNVEAAQMLRGGGGKLELGEKEALLKMARFRKHSHVETLLIDDLKKSGNEKSACFYSLFRSLGICSSHEIDEVKNNTNSLLYQFFSAVFNGRTKEVELKLSQNGSLFTRNDLWMALALAAFGGSDDIVKILLENRADVNGKSVRSGWTALMYASLNGHASTVGLLIEHGASLFISSATTSWTTLHIAAKNNHVEVVEVLLQNGAEIEAKSSDKDETPLHMAAESGNVGVVSKLIAFKANIGARQCDDRTPLAIASFYGYDDVVNLLLANGAEVDSKEKEDCTPLMFAAMNGHEQVVKSLMANGANFNERQKDDCTAFMLAATGGYDGIIKLLISNSNSAISICSMVNAKNKHDWTALICAACHGHEAVVRMLLANKADVNAKTKHGDTAIDWATKNGHQNIAKFLAVKMMSRSSFSTER